MKMYDSSRRQRVYHLICLLFPLVSLCYMARFLIRAVNNHESSFLYWGMLILVIIMGFIGLFGYGWKFFDDPILGKYSFDSYGVTFYTPIHTITFPYAECAEIGFTNWVGASTLSNRQYMFYIYLSKIKLNDEQRRYLFEGRSKKKRGARNMPLYHSEYLLFQYNPDAFAEFVKCIPEPFHSKLSEEERLLNLTSREKKLNR